MQPKATQFKLQARKMWFSKKIVTQLHGHYLHTLYGKITFSPVTRPLVVPKLHAGKSIKGHEETFQVFFFITQHRHNNTYAPNAINEVDFKFECQLISALCN